MAKILIYYCIFAHNNLDYVDLCKRRDELIAEMT